MLVTWNMQGSSASTENKWNVGVLGLLQQLRADVLCLQECGAIPDTALRVAQDIGGTFGLDLYVWGGTTGRPLAHVLHYPWDAGGNRCNLALVLRGAPAHAAIVWPQVDPIWRPALGAWIGGRIYFSVHAISPRGPDAAGLLVAMNARAAADGLPWAAGGDWNRLPGTIARPQWVAECPSQGGQIAHGGIDYAFSNYVQCVGQVLGLVLSDHAPVAFAPL